MTRVPMIFGTMTIGDGDRDGIRTSDMSDAQEIIDTFISFGHKELDTARVYGGGTTEKALAGLKLQDCTIDTKVYPMEAGMHQPATLWKIFEESLATLKRPSVRVLYLHAPDRSVPFADTCEEINKLHKEGKIQQFGLSNFAAWEAAEVATICKERGYVMPTIYQAMYNAITREIESELVPFCRKFGLRIVVYNPLAGGFFAGKIMSKDDKPEAGSRFDMKEGQSRVGTMYQGRYFKDGYFEALKLLRATADKHDLRLTEVALRWAQHHSVLKETDGVIIGASSAAQLKQNCEDSEKGPLPDEVVKALDEAHVLVKSSGQSPSYWR